MQRIFRFGSFRSFGSNKKKEKQRRELQLLPRLLWEVLSEMEMRDRSGIGFTIFPWKIIYDEVWVCHFYLGKYL